MKSFSKKKKKRKNDYHNKWSGGSFALKIYIKKYSNTQKILDNLICQKNVRTKKKKSIQLLLPLLLFRVKIKKWELLTNKWDKWGDELEGKDMDQP